MMWVIHSSKASNAARAPTHEQVIRLQERLERTLERWEVGKLDYVVIDRARCPHWEQKYRDDPVRTHNDGAHEVQEPRYAERGKREANNAVPTPKGRPVQRHRTG